MSSPHSPIKKIKKKKSYIVDVKGGGTANIHKVFGGGVIFQTTT